MIEPILSEIMRGVRCMTICKVDRLAIDSRAALFLGGSLMRLPIAEVGLPPAEMQVPTARAGRIQRCQRSRAPRGFAEPLFYLGVSVQVFLQLSSLASRTFIPVIEGRIAVVKFAASLSKCSVVFSRA
jgi:hypothetical protein